MLKNIILTTQLFIALSLGACNAIDDEPADPTQGSAGTGGPSTCEEIAAQLECPPGTTIRVFSAGAGVTLIGIDDPQAGIGVGAGIILGVGAVADYIATQIVDNGSCTAACVVDNPCGTPDEHVDDSGGPEEPPEAEIPNACVTNPVNQYGIPSACYFCGEVTPEQCVDIVLACGGIDPNPPGDDGDDGDDGSADESTSGADEGGDEGGAGGSIRGPGNIGSRAASSFEQRPPVNDGLGIGRNGKAHDCKRWDPLRYINRDSRGVVYADEPLLEAIMKVGGKTLSECDKSAFYVTSDGHMAVSRMKKGGVFEEFGLQSGDVILSVDGIDARQLDMVYELIETRLKSPHSSASGFAVRVRRGKKELIIPVFVD